MIELEPAKLDVETMVVDGFTSIKITIANSTNEIFVAVQPQQAQDIAEEISKRAWKGQTGRTELGQKIMKSNFLAKMEIRVAHLIRRGLEKSKAIEYISKDVLNAIWTEFT